MSETCLKTEQKIKVRRRAITRFGKTVKPSLASGKVTSKLVYIYG